MSWYLLELKGGLDDVTDRAWRQVWNAAYADATYDPTNAMFRSVSKPGGCALYFTPAAAELANTFGARSCRKPSGEKLVLVAGSAQSCDIHFPRTRISRSMGLLSGPDLQAPSFFSTQPVSAFASTQAALSSD